MTVAERIGLPSFLGWLVEYPPLTFFFSLVITPGMVWLLAAVFESRVAGRDFRPFRGAFKAFMPGELWLAYGLNCFASACASIDATMAWYNSRRFHIAVFAVWVIIGLVLREFKEKRTLGYTKAQLWSPSKVYHDFVLYMGYGYVLTVTGFAALAGIDYGFNSQTAWTVGGIIGVSVWTVMMLKDGATYNRNRTEFNRLVAMAHGSWNPIWRSTK